MQSADMRHREEPKEPPQMPKNNSSGDNSTAQEAATESTNEESTETTGTNSEVEDNSPQEDQHGSEEDNGAESTDTTESDDDTIEDESDDNSDHEKTIESFKRELSRKNRENSNLRARAKESERQVARMKAAIDAGLPADLIPRLVGDTPEELANDAQALVERFGRANYVPGIPPRDGRERIVSQDAEESDIVKIGERIYRH